MEEVKAALNSKELKKKFEVKFEWKGEGLSIKGRFDKRDKKDNKNRGHSRSKSKNTIYKCCTCHKEGYFRMGWPKRKNNQSERLKETEEATIVMDGYNSVEGLTIS